MAFHGCIRFATPQCGAVDSRRAVPSNRLSRCINDQPFKSMKVLSHSSRSESAQLRISIALESQPTVEGGTDRKTPKFQWRPSAGDHYTRASKKAFRASPLRLLTWLPNVSASSAEYLAFCCADPRLARSPVSWPPPLKCAVRLPIAAGAAAHRNPGGPETSP